jgi:hypothetical protein
LIHLAAPNDVNGNPRRVYVAIRGGAIVGAWDEGYAGWGAVPAGPLRELARIVERIPTTPGAYRAILKSHGRR